MGVLASSAPQSPYSCTPSCLRMLDNWSILRPLPVILEQTSMAYHGMRGLYSLSDDQCRFQDSMHMIALVLCQCVLARP